MDILKYMLEGFESDALPDGIRSYMECEKARTTKYLSHISLYDGEVIMRTFAYRRTKRQDIEYTEVSRRSTGTNVELLRNIYYTTYAGYCVVYPSKKKLYSYYFNDDDRDHWYQGYKSRIGIGYNVINKSILKSTKEFQYCGYDDSCGDLIEYLKRYKNNKKVELFGKLKIKPSKPLMNKCEKDKQFARFIRDNVEDVRRYGTNATTYAYNHGTTIQQASNIITYKICCSKCINRDIPAAEGTTIDKVRLMEYLEDNLIGKRSYNDYLTAVIALGLNLSDTKNIYPNDFQRMHDLRIQEYKAKKAKETEEKRKQMFKQFATVSDKYEKYCTNGITFCIVIPHSPDDLKNEGAKLHHCVGAMGYDNKMAEERSLIYFVRKANEKENPFVTIEVSTTFKLLQCYGDRDSKPADDVLSFVNEWCEKVKKEMKNENRKD